MRRLWRRQEQQSVASRVRKKRVSGHGAAGAHHVCGAAEALDGNCLAVGRLRSFRSSIQNAPCLVGDLRPRPSAGCLSTAAGGPVAKTKPVVHPSSADSERDSDQIIIMWRLRLRGALLLFGALLESTLGQRVGELLGDFHPVIRKVLKMRIWGIPPAGGPLPTAQAGPRNSHIKIGQKSG